MGKEQLIKRLRRSVVAKQFIPIILNLSNNSDVSEIETLLKNDINIIDKFDSWTKEAFIISFPKFKSNKGYLKTPEFEEFCKNNNLTNKEFSGNWVFFPWSNELIHILPEKLHHQVLTARNKNLVTNQEQEKFYNTNISIAGLSVGQSAALTIATSGGAKNMSLADFDTLEGTNLNRIKGTISDIGLHKTNIVAKQIYSINPFSKLRLFHEGLTDQNIDKFLEGTKLIVDEIDNFHFKAVLRVKAQERKLPLISAFDTADGIVLDVERYDLKIGQKPFFGKLTEKEFQTLVNSEPHPSEIAKFVIKTMGSEVIPDQFKASILKVGSELAGVPQLGSTAFLAGISVNFAARMIVNGDGLSGRFHFDFRKLTNTKYGIELTEEELKIFGHITSD